MITGSVASSYHAEPRATRDLDIVIDSREAFGRRTRATLLGASAWIASPEGAIIATLEWALAGGSDRQLVDVVACSTSEASRSTLAASSAGSQISGCMQPGAGRGGSEHPNDQGLPRADDA